MTQTFLRLITLCAVLALPVVSVASENTPDAEQDILVTFIDARAGSPRGGMGPPYRNRKRYSISANAKRDAVGVASDYMLKEIESWPIRSLAVYCVVYRPENDMQRDTLIERLSEDPRVESVQPVNEFGTKSEATDYYDDPHVNLQHGLKTMSVTAAHARSRGRGVTIAIVDSNADARHEDLRGRLRRTESFTDDEQTMDVYHGTAVASVIGARSNNAKGIVGIAPEARLEVFAACWESDDRDRAICDSFTLAKALDTVLNDPPDVVNLSLVGPGDALLERLLRRLHQRGAILVAAAADDPQSVNRFPANLDFVLGITSSQGGAGNLDTALNRRDLTRSLHAPGKQVLVATPDNGYDFRSGSSIASAHVSGVVALMLAKNPGLSLDAVRNALLQSQASNPSESNSVNACIAIGLVADARDCS
jgi:subtilisin family serine protease